ncbi:MAG: septum site-determining protein MinC [Selenomonadaceae bacterium]|nr:septum site-determining protein MinC [Selenomonadaceae bacterium]
MSEDIVKIKGIKQGLLLIFASDSKFDEIEENIQKKLSLGFFTRGTPVYIQPEDLPKDDAETLKKIFAKYGLICKIENPENEIREIKQEEPQREEVSFAKPEVKVEGEKVEEMMVVNKTLRGGQEIRTKASVLVCGNVNPGAQIIAGGSIDIRGKCLGVVHAGAFGNQDAVIIADRLLPTQIRIANLVARAPDEGDETEKPERASIKDGQIVIEPIER